MQSLGKLARSRQGPLILTFDAFGTLFTPREPIARIYAERARRYGIEGFAEEDIRLRFRKVFKHEASKRPNYGKYEGMTSAEWWANVIQSTFTPYTSTVPAQLTHDLYTLFTSSRGYTLCPDVRPFFNTLRLHRQSSTLPVVTGVISNSDDRIPSILSSLGLNTAHNLPNYDGRDLDFVLTSYEAEISKPSQGIFDKALRRGTDSLARGTERPLPMCVHIGDDIDEDYRGARDAGWHAVLVRREGVNHATLHQESRKKAENGKGVVIIESLRELEHLFTQ